MSVQAVDIGIQIVTHLSSALICNTFNKIWKLCDKMRLKKVKYHYHSVYSVVAFYAIFIQWNMKYINTISLHVKLLKQHKSQKFKKIAQPAFNIKWGDSTSKLGACCVFSSLCATEKW
jgi:hypothetical protein